MDENRVWESYFMTFYQRDLFARVIPQMFQQIFNVQQIFSIGSP